MYLGVDLGTSSIKVLLSDENGNILSSISKNFKLYNPLPNYYEENPDEWYQTLVDILLDLNKKHNIKEVKAISFSGQMHGLVTLDKYGKVIRNAILWNDSRNEKEVEYLNNTVGEQFLLKEVSNIAMCGFTLPKLLWMKNHEKDNFESINKIMLPKDYLVYKLSGNFVSDKSDLSGTLLYNSQKNVYSAKILNILGINESQLPKILNSYECAGNVSEKASLETGLSQNCMVIVGGGDQAVGALGAGILDENEMSMSLGTSGTLFASLNQFSYDTKARVHSFKHVNDKFCFLACTLSCANSLTRWVKKILNKKDFESVLNEIDVDSKNEILFLPYLCGERCPINNPKAKGTFFGLNDYYLKKDLTKAVVEGIAFSLYDNFLIFKELGVNPSKIITIGGASRNNKIMQIFADIFNVPLVRITTSEGCGLGAVLLAIKGKNPEVDFKELTKKVVKEKDEFLPRLNYHEFYQKKFIKYEQLYKATLELL